MHKHISKNEIRFFCIIFPPEPILNKNASIGTSEKFISNTERCLQSERTVLRLIRVFYKKKFGFSTSD